VANPFPEFFDLGPDFLTEAQAVDIRRRRYNSQPVTNAEIVRLRQFDSRQTQLRHLLNGAPETQGVRGVRAFAQLSLDLERGEQTARVRDLRTAITIFFRESGNEAILHMTRVEIMADDAAAKQKNPPPAPIGPAVQEPKTITELAEQILIERHLLAKDFARGASNAELLKILNDSGQLKDGYLRPNPALPELYRVEVLAVIQELDRRIERGSITPDFQLLIQVGGIAVRPGTAAAIAAVKAGVVYVAPTPADPNPGYTLFADSGALQQLSVLSAGIASGLATYVNPNGVVGGKPPRVERPPQAPGTGSQNQPFGGPGQFPDGFFARNPADP
jgi:hypothetical protein